MAAGDHSAAALRRRTAAVLAAAALEWTLIALLLLNALLSYLISKFASFFGLRPPCILCSRVDRLFDPAASYRDLLCGAHADELSGLRYCPHRRRLAPAGSECELCEPLRPPEAAVLLPESSRGGLAMTHERDLEEDEERAAKRDLALAKDPFLDVLALRGGQLVGGDKLRLVPVELIDSATLRESYVSHRLLARDGDGGLVPLERDGGLVPLERDTTEQNAARVPAIERDISLLLADGARLVEAEEIHGVPGKVGVGVEVEALAAYADLGMRQVLVEFTNSTTVVEHTVSTWPAIDDEGDLGHDVLESDCTEQNVVSSPETEINDIDIPYILGTVDSIEEQHPSEVVHAVPGEDGVGLEFAALASDDYFGDARGMSSEDESKAMDVETSCEISIGSEICDQEQIDRSHFLEPALVPISSEVQCSDNYNEPTDRDQVIETKPVEIVIRGKDCLSVYPELNVIEEDRLPETPNSIDGVHALHKRFFFERRDPGTESLDGSVASEVEGSEILTVDRLKTALQAKRTALSSLYAELEEERSASAIAANQTMAMITRLQQEKAAMQMEALQYQRMMEELSEYDQEALQLMNEHMVQKEKEKQDLEKELEVYRKKVLLYESKVRRKMVRGKANVRNATSSASSSAGDSDDISSTCHGSDKCFNILDRSNQHNPTDAALSFGELPDTEKHLVTLDESLADFEEERLFILERLRALEEKLFTLDEEEPSNNLETMEHFLEGNGHVQSGVCEASCHDEIGFMSIFSDDLDANGNHHSERSSTGCRGKRLLPLFDAISMENDDVLCTRPEETDTTTESVSKSSSDHKKFEFSEEIDNVYERLQVLEAEREFLKHCVSSLKKGDKGMYFLQEILQHLRDLRNVEPRVRSTHDALASLSA